MIIILLSVMATPPQRRASARGALLGGRLLAVRFIGLVITRVVRGVVRSVIVGRLVFDSGRSGFVRGNLVRGRALKRLVAGGDVELRPVIVRTGGRGGRKLVGGSAVLQNRHEVTQDLFADEHAALDL